MAQALVPLKDLVQAKTRLAGVLRPSERRALAQAMVEDVLEVVACHPSLCRVVLLSDDPSASLLAAKYAIQCWPERELGTTEGGPCGLNSLIGSASRRLLDELEEEPVLVLHGDLPLLGSADITAVLDYQRESQGLVIGCDRLGSGTNLLAFDANSTPRFCFGRGSCERHRQAAVDASIPVGVIRRPGIALDIDEPDDLAALLAVIERASCTGTFGGPASHSAALLGATALAERIRLALGSPGGQTCGESGLAYPVDKEQRL